MSGGRQQTVRRGGLRSVLLAMALAFGMLARLALADSAPSAFDAANKLYAEGKFGEAATAYQQLLASGPVSSALYFNLANALFKSGQTGRAIAAYRNAARLTPRDPDVRANLEFARSRVGGPTHPPGRWQRWLGTLTVNEWTVLAVAPFWGVFLLLALGQVRPGWKRPLRVYVATAAGVALLFGAGLALALRNDSASDTAIVVAREAVARSSPFDEAPAAFTVHDGAELDLLDQTTHWLQVTDGGKQIGWVKRDALLVFNAAPLPAAKTGAGD